MGFWPVFDQVSSDYGSFNFTNSDFAVSICPSKAGWTRFNQIRETLYFIYCFPIGDNMFACKRTHSENMEMLN